MSVEVFEEYLDRLAVDFEVDDENDAIDLRLETSWGHPYLATLVETRTRYVLYVSPLVVLGAAPDLPALHRRMLELADASRHVKLALDLDGDVKVAVEGFTRLDGYGQLRRRFEALTAFVEEHGRELAEIADGDLA